MATTSNYRTYYADANNDPYGGVYVSILNEYETTANQPQELRNKIYSSGNAGRALGHLLLVRETTQAGGNKSDTTPFRLCDVGLQVGAQRCDPLTTPLTTLANATFITLEFTTQKNGVRGEVIGLARSGDVNLCPVAAVVRRITHLRQRGANANTPLAAFYTPQHKLQPVTPKDITETLRLAATVLGPQLGFLPKHISARSLRAAGAMALLCGHVDTDIIRLLGRWRSDEMLRYLHVQAAPVMRDFSAIMLTGGHFTLFPNHEVPSQR